MPEQVEIKRNTINVNVSGNANSSYALSILHEIQPGYAFVTTPTHKVSGEKILSHLLGIGSALIGQKVFCTSTVSDVRPDTNETNVRILISQDGELINDQPFNFAVNPNHSVVYHTTIDFQ